MERPTPDLQVGDEVFVDLGPKSAFFKATVVEPPDANRRIVLCTLEGRQLAFTMGPEAMVWKPEEEDPVLLAAEAHFNQEEAILHALATSQLVPVMDWLVDRAARLGYPIALDRGRPRGQCSVNWVDHATYINPDRPPSPDVIWDLIHEQGHVLQEKAHFGSGRSPREIKEFLDQQTRDEKLKWEHGAWSAGWDAAIEQFPVLTHRAREFWLHGNESTASYCGWTPRSQRTR